MWRLFGCFYFNVWQRQKIHIKMIDGHELWLITAKLAMWCWYHQINCDFKNGSKEKQTPKIGITNAIWISLNNRFIWKLTNNSFIAIQGKVWLRQFEKKKFQRIPLTPFLILRFHSVKMIEKNGPISSIRMRWFWCSFSWRHTFSTLFFSLRDTSSITILIIIYQTKSFKMTK